MAHEKTLSALFDDTKSGNFNQSQVRGRHLSKLDAVYEWRWLHRRHSCFPPSWDASWVSSRQSLLLVCWHPELEFSFTACLHALATSSVFVEICTHRKAKRTKMSIYWWNFSRTCSVSFLALSLLSVALAGDIPIQDCGEYFHFPRVNRFKLFLSTLRL